MTVETRLLFGMTLNMFWKRALQVAVTSDLSALKNTIQRGSCISNNIYICIHRLLFPWVINLFVVGVVCPCNIIRSYQGRYRLITEHTHSNFIVLPCWLFRLSVLWSNILPTQSHYPDTELTSPCPIPLMPSASLGNNKVQLFFSINNWFDSTVKQSPTHEPQGLPIRPLRSVVICQHSLRIYIYIYIYVCVYIYI